MVITLAAVLWAMHYMRSSQSAAPNGFVGVLPHPADTFNLCPTRVVWLELADARIAEQAGKWLRTDRAGQVTELDPIAVEKWLSSFCSALTDEHPGEAVTEGWQPSLRIGYVTGTPQALDGRTTKEGPTEYHLGHHHFGSHDIDEALHTIITLPPAKAPGTP